MRTELPQRCSPGCRASLTGLALALALGCQALPLAPSPGELVVELTDSPSRGGRSVLYLEAEATRPPDSRHSRVVEVASRGSAFQPALTAVRAGDSIRFQNGGSVAHRLFVTDRDGRRERRVEPGRSSESLRISRAGEHRFYCSLHPNEGFVLFAAPSIHFVVLAAGGAHRLENIPSGSYKLRRWSEAGTESLGVVEILPGQTATRVLASGSAP